MRIELKGKLSQGDKEKIIKRLKDYVDILHGVIDISFTFENEIDRGVVKYQKITLKVKALKDGFELKKIKESEIYCYEQY